MSSNQTNTIFKPTAVALLRAVGSPAELSGAAHLLPNIRSCFEAAAKLWPTEQSQAWAQLATQMQCDLAEAKSLASGVTTELFTLSEKRTKTFDQFISMQAPILTSGSAFNEHALLGRAVAQCAAKKQMLSIDLLIGLRRLAKARQQEGGGSRSEDWKKLLVVNLTDEARLQELLVNLHPKSPTFAFITAAISVVRNVCQFPATDHASIEETKSQSGEGVGIDEPNPNNSGIQNAQQKAPKTGDDDADTGPDIKKRLKDAEHASFAEKLGFYHRDHLILDDFAFITRQFPKIVEEGSAKEKGFAILATFLPITGCRDEVALELQFHPESSMWLDVSRGAWGWDFNQYRSFRGDQIETQDVQPIFTSWPSFLDAPLHKAFKACPSAKSLNDLILTIQGVDHFDLKGFRRFLRSCGNPAHPAHFARFARSMAPAYLTVTGSDMTACRNTGRFPISAAAALYYYGPSNNTLKLRTAQVYERLGWGLPSALDNESGRAGCKKVLDVDELTRGWGELCQAINTARDCAMRAKDPESTLKHCNRWMGLLATAFVIQTAHRSSRLECLTVAAIFVHPEVMSIHDKDEGDRVQPRLVPKTEATDIILFSAIECSKLAHSQVLVSNKPSIFSLAASDCVFCTWKICQDKLETSVLETKVIAENTMKFFKSDANFGRSNWVTHLDEDNCHRWLIRSLTGHTRDISRVHGPCFDVPPLTIAARLRLEMELTSARIFGSTNISLESNELPAIEYGVMNGHKGVPVLSDRVPDPRTLLEPLTSNVLLEWHMCEQIRNDLVSGRIDAPPAVLTILHMLLIDQIPCKELCVSALTKRGTVVKAISGHVGLSWERLHFTHNTWLPIQRTTWTLLEQLGDTVFERDELIEKICQVLRQMYPGVWPKSVKSCWSILGSLGASFRRLTFPRRYTPSPSRQYLHPVSMKTLLNDFLALKSLLHSIYSR